jgi:DNA modification methylase
MKKTLTDIKPYSPVRELDRDYLVQTDARFPTELVAEVLGMLPTFVRKVVGAGDKITGQQLLQLLDQDSYAETFVPRSLIPAFLLREMSHIEGSKAMTLPSRGSVAFVKGNAHDLLEGLPDSSVSCVVTSTPYWGTRIYDYSEDVSWADGETCPFGHEQTPEGFVRHSVEMLWKLKRILKSNGSIWWNLMDTFNTRTQIRTNAAEALRAMQGKDKSSWGDYECRRYSAGHSFLKDGEQCGIPARIATRASRIGLYVKSTITWAKNGSLPEPQNSRVSRALEYVLHLSKERTPYFNKEAYLSSAPEIGGRNPGPESSKLTDVWFLSTSAGRDGHGAQFPLALPGRCIVLSTLEDDLVLDPFAGGGTSAVASKILRRRFLGFDVSSKYLAIAEKCVARANGRTNEFQDALELS